MEPEGSIYRIQKCLFLSWASSIQSIPPHPTSWRSILILSSLLRLGLQSGFFPSGFSTKTLYTPLLSPIRATCPAHLVLLAFITRTFGEQCRSLSSSLCSFLHSLITSSLLGPNILLNTLFLNTLSLRSSLNASDQFSHPYKTNDKIIVLYILTVLFSYLSKTGYVFPPQYIGCMPINAYSNMQFHTQDVRYFTTSTRMSLVVSYFTQCRIQYEYFPKSALLFG